VCERGRNSVVGEAQNCNSGRRRRRRREGGGGGVGERQRETLISFCGLDF
jgi:hypothetical protein